ncbi:ent-copalyl diphosphate synthase 1-like [Actinidia eriantha]|uniref:ent-copalyl diphosphate synthase 1-like n=1 Tax=Actinidia eriantha TaxID=165200 RepID=UPI002588803B|nr:ent-copalyl diphosphate synthase 1-like [Actinidia eriantha]
MIPSTTSSNLLGSRFCPLLFTLSPFISLLLAYPLSKKNYTTYTSQQQHIRKNMSSHFFTHPWHVLSPAISGDPALLSLQKQPFLSVWPLGAKEERANLGVPLKCKALYKPITKEYKEVFQHGLPVIKWKEVVEDDIEGEEALDEGFATKKIKEHVDSIRSMLGSMEDGEISISAYDTAWVALVEDIEGSGGPQFPSSLQWIANNQLQDGSWGDSTIFEAHDRIINTLACVIALKSWNVHPLKSKKGMAFIKENISKLEDEKAEHMPIGFEVAFPSLIEIARKLDIQVPIDSPILQEIYARRNLKLTRIPKDIMHNVPTTLLHSLEGMEGLEWKKLLKLQSPDGSFLFSPSSTAFALIHTKDDHCLNYLTTAVQRFNGGVPNVYPVDLFEHMWAVDRLDRLGISRYFKAEIKECIDYVQRYWTEEGICWARNSRVHDIDDTAMGFRLLRLHGRQVSADVFKHFEKGGEFFCFVGQSTQAVTGMFNLYRASQVLFPGEKILEDAKKFSSKFLREKRACNELLDKWIITKDLPGEVGYALDVPWNASLPRLETRFYLEQYGGEDDVWIGKTLYRMSNVNNNTYLELAKLDYNYCQALHQLEWDSIQKWYAKCNLGEFGMSQRNGLLRYYLAATSIFEPERSKERLAWAKTAILVETIVSYFKKEGNSTKQRRQFLHEFKNNCSHLDYTNNGRYKKTTGQGLRLIGTLLATISQLSLDTLVTHGRDIRHHLRHLWETWMMTWQEDGDVHKREAELLVRTMNLCAGRLVYEEQFLVSYPQYKRLTDITNRVCHQLREFQQKLNMKVHDKDYCNASIRIESDMQELVQLVLYSSSKDIDPDTKQTFLAVAKSYYYTVHCTPETIDFHIAKVLFDRVV